MKYLICFHNLLCIDSLAKKEYIKISRYILGKTATLESLYWSQKLAIFWLKLWAQQL